MRNNTQVSVRGRKILDELLRNGSVNVEELAKSLEVSIATVRRDLSVLEKLGRLRRTHGGAILLEPVLYEPFRDDSSFQEQLKRHAEEKLRIALAAAELIGEGETLAFTPDTTTTQITRSIPHYPDITVITTTVNVAMELTKRTDLTVFVSGGFLRGGWFSLVGAPAIRALSEIFVDKAFIGVNGIHAEKGLTTYNHDEAATNRALIQQPREKIVVADHSKLGIIASSLICRADEVDLLITDSGATDEVIEPFMKKGLEVRRV